MPGLKALFGSQRKHSFQEGVAAFWEWYPTVADRFFRTIEAGHCEDLVGETGEFMAEQLPNLAWVFGPGEGQGHSFTVSGEGNVAKQLLADHWRSQALAMPGWTFYGARQASPPENLKGMAIAVGEEESVDTDSFLIKTSVDDEAELIDIVAWHPALELVPEEHHHQILFLLLDETLGEFGTQTWLGDIAIAPFDESEEHVRPLASLPGYIEGVQKYHGWEKLPPPEAYSVYQLHEQHRGPRGDTVVGSSILAEVFCEFISNNGKLEEDPLEGTGAELAYISMDSSQLPDGQQAEVRGNMEDAIEAALTEQLSGKVLGGAFGLEHSYIDLLLLDGKRSLAIVEEQMKILQLRKAKLHFLH